jgi:hypothetical protein
VVVEGVLLHVSYTAKTRFFHNDSESTFSATHRGEKGVITYSRDRFGRIIASKVELFDG